MKTKILADFQICISVPLKERDIIFLTQYSKYAECDKLYIDQASFNDKANNKAVLNILSLFSTPIAKIGSIWHININYMLKKENGHSFPKLYLKITRKTLHFHFSHVSELNFHNCKIIDNYSLPHGISK